MSTGTHYHSRKGAWSPTYYSWAGMIQRCENPARNNYHNYGGRGIRVCERWKTFANFLEDMGARVDGMSLDRLNSDGNYEPGNCVWADRPAQNRNRRNNKLIAADIPRILDLRKCGATWREIGEYFSVTKTLIGHILKGKTWARS